MMEFEQHPTKPNTLIIKMPTYEITKYSYEDLRAAVLAEREACARLCESEGHRIDASWESCATAIRARGEK
jgi:hypothetical protein